MSLKSSDNIVRNNTILNCRGAICMRLGNHNVVSGNFIIATEGGPGFGGIKLYGFEHRVFNNYFSGLTVRRHDAPFALVPGMYDTPTTDNIGKKYDDNTAAAPTRCWIAFNTWVDCSPLQLGFEKEEIGRQHSPNACAFINNLVVRTKPMPTPLINLGRVRDLQAHDNLGFTDGPAPTTDWACWFHFADPQMLLAEKGLWLLTAHSPAIDSAVEDSTTMADDIFGHARKGRYDLGAEEFSLETAAHTVLTPDKVGPDAP